MQFLTFTIAENEDGFFFWRSVILNLSKSLVETALRFSSKCSTSFAFIAQTQTWKMNLIFFATQNLVHMLVFARRSILAHSSETEEEGTGTTHAHMEAPPPPSLSLTHTHTFWLSCKNKWVGVQKNVYKQLCPNANISKGGKEWWSCQGIVIRFDNISFGTTTRIFQPKYKMQTTSFQDFLL
jgi:hypothetical protein